MHDDEIGVEPQPINPRDPLCVHGRVGRIAVPPAPVHPQNLPRSAIAVGFEHGLPQLRARRPQALLIDALQLALVRDRRSTYATRRSSSDKPMPGRRAGTQGNEACRGGQHESRGEYLAWRCSGPGGIPWGSAAPALPLPPSKLHSCGLQWPEWQGIWARRCVALCGESSSSSGPAHLPWAPLLHLPSDGCSY